MKSLTLITVLLTINTFSFANTYHPELIQSYLESRGTTHDPLIQMQSLACGMAAYNTMKKADLIIKQNKTIIEQNKEILSLLKK